MKHMKTRTKILITASIIAVIIIIQIIAANVGQGMVMRFEETGFIQPYNFDASPSFFGTDDNEVFFATRDGMRYINISRPDASWAHTFSLPRPVMVGRGNMVAVGDQSGGRRVYVFNREGYMFHQDFDHPILTFSINETGILAVVLQYSTGHGIYVLSQQSVIERPDGNPWAYRRAEMEELIYPIAVEVSPDGRHIITAMLDIRVRPTTILQFGHVFQADALDTGRTDGIFSEERLDGQLVYGMQFMSDNRLIVATTSQIVAYRITPRVQTFSMQEEIWSIPLLNNLTHLEFYGNSHVVYVLGDRLIGDPDALPAGTVHIRNAAGTLTGTFTLGRRATHLSVGHGSFIVGADRNFHAVTLTGNHLWEHNVLFDTTRHGSVIFLNNTDNILVAGLNRAIAYERRRTRANEFESMWDTP